MNTLPFPTRFRPSPSLAIIIDSFVVSVLALIQLVGFLLLVFSLLFLFFGSVRQIKLAVRQLLGAHKYSLSYRIYDKLL